MRELPYLLGVLLLIALLLRLDFVFYVVYVVGGIWLLARWATPRSMKALAVQRSFVSHAFLDETIPVRLELHNQTRLPMPWLRVGEALPPDLASTAQISRVYTLRPRERVTIDYNLRCLRRGYYPIGPLRLTSGDLFGFADVQSRGEGVQYLTVYPRIIPLVGLALPSRLPFGVLASCALSYGTPLEVAVRVSAGAALLSMAPSGLEDRLSKLLPYATGGVCLSLGFTPALGVILDTRFVTYFERSYEELSPLLGLVPTVLLYLRM